MILLAYCSLIGATTISIEFYTVIWGKATEQKEDEEEVGSSVDILSCLYVTFCFWLRV